VSYNLLAFGDTTWYHQKLEDYKTQHITHWSCIYRYS